MRGQRRCGERRGDRMGRCGVKKTQGQSSGTGVHDLQYS